MRTVIFASVMVGFLLVLGTVMADDRSTTESPKADKMTSIVRMNRITHDKELTTPDGQMVGRYDSSLIAVQGNIVNLSGIKMMVFPPRQAQ